MCSFAQVDTSRTVQHVELINIQHIVKIYPINPIESQRLGRLQIEQIQPEDVGQLLQKFAGVSLKSYGGLGGLKTFSFRSLGSQHTATVINGFTQGNSQTGQLNLGQIQTSNIESVSLGKSTNYVLTPVSSLVMANELSLQTFEGKEFLNSTRIRATVKAGSFGQTDNYLAFHKSKNKFGYTVFGKYRQAEGNYPYSLKVGNFNYDGIRSNNKVKDIYGGLSLFFRPNEMKQPIRFMYRNSFIDQELPGAVILNSISNKQFLNSEQHNLALDWVDKWTLTDVRYYTSYQYNEQRYLDSSYLNNQGFLKRNFYQNSATAGLRLKRSKYGELLKFYGGIEQQLAYLNMVSSDDVLPKRYTTFSSAGINIDEKKYQVDMRLSHQLVLEQKKTNESLKTRNLVSPFLSISLKERGRYRWSIGAKTAATSRLPSFNELYFGQVGNQDLEPERVLQYVLSNNFARYKGRFEWRNRLSIYHNRIRNKILAIPTKNLFVWSIQNIGVVHATGLDLSQDFVVRYKNQVSIELDLNYSYQRSINQTNDDPNKGSQIAYVPVHSGNADLTLKRKRLGVRFSNSFVGERFSLNENIPNNAMDPFANMDISLFFSLSLKAKHKLNFQFQVKNLLDENYTYVRSFVMPGRNYLITLSYALY